MNELIEFIKGDAFSALGSISSIVSLILTFLVFLGVRNIKRFYIFTARVPELNDRLSEAASKIASALNSGSITSDSTAEILADTEAILKSLIRKVDKPLKADAKRLIKNIQSMDGCDKVWCRAYKHFFSSENQDTQENFESRLRDVYLSLYRLNAECREVYEDSRWEH